METPIITIQWETVLAVSYAARSCGISRWVVCRLLKLSNSETPIAQARILCPELVVAHVATFREGDSAPGYRDDPDVKLDKVGLLLGSC